MITLYNEEIYIRGYRKQINNLIKKRKNRIEEEIYKLMELKYKHSNIKKFQKYMKEFQEQVSNSNVINYPITQKQNILSKALFFKNSLNDSSIFLDITKS